ncbi:MAG: UDP-N-acetylmuramoyl-L-alanyl-D-glutamate--2,6-diaminopimelate ligase [Spirochaetia bacterium]|nr:UDP-N-acetylmuramoyl-L-alanyl-D-glutamate--2,6-diaminopimelate ligase [Spirochaetota bacterium]MDW8112252.1 UDP-N-acetylmuramoyl-L-alanyl-D-glutamate--2,6-diaminopimelate ligase [Spirochaetia bacterium]
MKLSRILELVKDYVVKSNLTIDIDISSISEDSRDEIIDSNTLFFAIEGSKVDATKFIPSLIERGCKTFITSKDVGYYEGVNIIQVKSIRRVEAIVSKAFYNRPDDRLKVFGVTGTKGKTTVSYMMFNGLRALGMKGGLIGTIEYRINDYSMNAENTTPGPLHIFTLLDEIVKNSCEFVSMEVSSHGLETDRVYGLKFDAGIFTNLSREHLDFHQTMENYFNAKMKLFHLIKEFNPDGIAVINIDNEWGRKAYEITKSLGIKTLTCSTVVDADIRAKNITVSLDGNLFTVSYRGKEFSTHTKMVGLHNIHNAICSLGAIVGVIGDDNIELVLNGISETTVKGRFEILRSSRGFYVVIDYAHTPDALEKTLETARAFSPTRLTVVFGAGGDRDKGKRPIMGQISANIADKVIVTSDNPRTENPFSIINDIIKGIPSDRIQKTKVIADRRKAIQVALKEAVEGEIIVIAGKGHETYQIIGEEKIHFSDYEEVVGSSYF